MEKITFPHQTTTTKTRDTANKNDYSKKRSEVWSLRGVHTYMFKVKYRWHVTQHCRRRTSCRKESCTLVCPHLNIESTTAVAIFVKTNSVSSFHTTRRNPVATLLILILIIVTNILPSGNFKPNVVYGWHATGSSRVSKMVRKGLLSLGAIWGFKPEKKDGPVSKWKVPSAAWSVNPCAAPPGTAWASNRATV